MRAIPTSLLALGLALGLLLASCHHGEEGEAVVGDSVESSEDGQRTQLMGDQERLQPPQPGAPDSVPQVSPEGENTAHSVEGPMQTPATGQTNEGLGSIIGNTVDEFFEDPQRITPGAGQVVAGERQAMAFIQDTAWRGSNPVAAANGLTFYDSTLWRGMPTGPVSPNPSGRTGTGRAELGEHEP